MTLATEVGMADALSLLATGFFACVYLGAVVVQLLGVRACLGCSTCRRLP